MASVTPAWEPECAGRGVQLPLKPQLTAQSYTILGTLHFLSFGIVDCPNPLASWGQLSLETRTG